MDILTTILYWAAGFLAVCFVWYVLWHLAASAVRDVFGTDETQRMERKQ